MVLLELCVVLQSGRGHVWCLCLRRRWAASADAAGYPTQAACLHTCCWVPDLMNREAGLLLPDTAMQCSILKAVKMTLALGASSKQVSSQLVKQVGCQRRCALLEVGSLDAQPLTAAKR